MAEAVFVNKTTTSGRQEYAEMQKKYLRTQKPSYSVLPRCA
ncbi:hypothetical protein SAMN02910447_03239 [Ruminococcus sp. YE71]|nr:MULTISPECIES: hypothetical protein [unclassified Ruminococcus]SDA30600.1 hypothetical protein SAMN02910446_03282 [Ruminococcus sp. YE78]SFW50130.1 hypothetical protein SAMN02910447_03239 [Ruminococcus sp. YE71]